jgi:8-oxo-dGTP pyrophosphatase MutT (NUDIX family)
MTSDHANFHIKRLLLLDIIQKTDHDTYELTQTGKEFANRYDTDSVDVQYEKQAKIGVIVKAYRDSEKGREYLIQQRLKHPFYGYHGCPGGKIKYAETVYDAAKRELSEETGLIGSPELVLIEHRTEVSISGDILEDKYFYIFRIKDPEGEMQSFDCGNNIWLTRSDILNLSDKFTGLIEGLDVVDNFSGGNPLFIERRNTVARY